MRTMSDEGVAWLDDDHLSTVSAADGSQVTWDLTPDHWLDRACELAGRDLTRAEWARYLPDQPYRRTCSDHSAAPLRDNARRRHSHRPARRQRLRRRSHDGVLGKRPALFAHMYGTEPSAEHALTPALHLTAGRRRFGRW